MATITLSVNSAKNLEKPIKNHEKKQIIESSKAFSIVKRIFKSPFFIPSTLFFNSSLALLATVTTAVNPLITFAVVSIRAYIFTEPLIANHKKIIYEFSLMLILIKNYLKSHPWFSQIDAHIYLGALPLEEKDHIKIFKDLNISSILSMVENFEYKNTIFSTPIKEKKWKENNFDYRQIASKDFFPLTLQQIEEGVAFLKTQIAKNKTTYVHCKAGVGRSTTVVCCYLINKNNWTVEQAIAHVKHIRPCIHLNNNQRAIIQKYYNKLHKIKKI